MALENLFLKKLALKVYRIDIESESIIETMINFYFHKTKDCNFRHDIFNFSETQSLINQDEYIVSCIWINFTNLTLSHIIREDFRKT